MQNKALATTSIRLRGLQRKPVSNSTEPIESLKSCSTVRSSTEASSASTLTQDQPEKVDKKQRYKGKKALIVGSGPAGSVASSFLATQGFQVDVFEQRNDPTKTTIAPTRSISVTLNSATIDTLKAANIDTPGSDEGYVNGMHRFLGASVLTSSGELVSPTSELKWLLVERVDFATQVMDTVRREHPEMITFHFEHPCVGVDLIKQEVQFQDHNNNIVKQNYDLLIGADGVNSQVRKAMEEQVDNFRAVITPNTRFYVSCPSIVVNKDKVPDKYEKMIQPGSVTSYTVDPKSGSMERRYLIIFSSLANGNLGVSVENIESGFEGIKANAEEYMKEVLPNDFLQDWIEQMIPQLQACPMYRLPSITEVSTLVGPNVVLIGDAGHAVSPSLAFGCNMAIQDGLALNEALEYAKGDINLALKVFNDNRYKKVRAFQFLEKVYSAKLLKHEGINKLLPLFADFHLLFHSLGNKYFPWLIPKTAIRRCLLEEISSGEAERSLRVELATLIALATSAVFLALAVIARLS